MFHKKSVIGLGTIELTFIKTSPALFKSPEWLNEYGGLIILGFFF